MNHQSDFGYSTGAVSMRCIACGSDKINCCDGHGRKFTHKIVGEDGCVAFYHSRASAEKVLRSLRTSRDTGHNFFEVREVCDAAPKATGL